jgi:hypothetical protein
LAWSEQAVMRNVVQLAGHDAPVSGYYFFICVDQNRDIDAEHRDALSYLADLFGTMRTRVLRIEA